MTVHGKPSAVLLSTKNLDPLEETIDLLADAIPRLHAFEAEHAHREVEGCDELEAAMAFRRNQRQ